MEYLQYFRSYWGDKPRAYVLNLVISGIPSIRRMPVIIRVDGKVLNLVISGIPSIPVNIDVYQICD